RRQVEWVEAGDVEVEVASAVVRVAQRARAAFEVAGEKGAAGTHREARGRARGLGTSVVDQHVNVVGAVGLLPHHRERVVSRDGGDSIVKGARLPGAAVQLNRREHLFRGRV